MQSAVSGLMQAFKEAFPVGTDGSDWEFVPYDMYIYGGGGIGGWASLCGIPNGCVALCNLIGLHGALGSDIMGHYSSSEWPSSQLPDLYYADAGYGPSNYTYVKQPIADGDVLAHVIPYSPLCHISISKWCYEAGVSLADMGPHAYQHKNDRCGKLCADMAAYTAELINNYATTGASADPYSLRADTAACGACHTTGSTLKGPATTGKMDCTECHMAPGTTFHTSGQFYIEDLWTEDNAGNPKTTFAPDDPIVYKVSFAILGPGSFFVRTKPGTTGEIIKTTGTLHKQAFNKSEECMSTVTTWSWSSTVPSNATQKGKFVVNLQLADTPTGPLFLEKAREVYFTVS
jgi:hypothetical protein